MAGPALPQLEWIENGEARAALWRSERGASPPKRVVVADDTMTADDAYELATQGTAMLWRSDFQNARQMLVALASRVDRPARRPRKQGDAASAKPPAEVFNLQRQARAQRARTLGMLLIQLEPDYSIALRRAPDLRSACVEAYGAPTGTSVASLRELLGLVGAHEWRRTGIVIEAAGGRIHPHYGVFAPIRSEYVDLVAGAPLPAALHGPKARAFDIGTGTGVLAAVLSLRGVTCVIATELDDRALACARDNIQRLGLTAQVSVVRADMFPEGRAELVVCNPPWVPARPSSSMELGIYDADSRILKAFLHGLIAHLELGGEGWLVLSDLAEHLGLRTRDALLGWIGAEGLRVLDRIDIRPRHPRAADPSDPLHAARAAEVTSLWRLVPA